MTQPRRHIAGQVALLTRRCFERRYFLRPDNYINDVIPFEVGKACKRHGQHVYAAVAMSNHVHFAVGDTTGDRSDFMRDAMSGIARARNRHLERRSFFWDSGSYGDTVLLDRDAIERKLLYIWLNPVRAGLVERASDWPGFKILPKHWGKKLRVEKPDEFYGRRNPDAVEFTPQPPPGYEEMSLEETRKHFEDLLRRAEDEIHAARAKQNIQFSGRAAVLAENPFDHPKTAAPMGRINPRFASKDSALLSSAIDSYRAFVKRYETKRQRWVAGRKRVTFPCGTVSLRRCAPIKCDDPRDDEPGLFATGTA